ncbi:HAD family hydrolase [Verrucomicrobiota bacterium]
MTDIRLIATDFDGTLAGRSDEFAYYIEFRDILKQLRKTHNTTWVVCTGRSLKSLRQLLAPMQMIGIMPNYVIMQHAYIYSYSDIGYIPHIFWNLRVLCHLWADTIRDKKAIRKWCHEVTGFFPAVKIVRIKKDRLFLRFNSDNAASLAVDMLKDKVKLHEHLTLFKYPREIDIRQILFTKGLAVSELARQIRIDPSNILAIGDGLNDISMLNGRIAKLTGCPANAAKDVIDTVHKSGGHIAKENSLSGVIETLKAYMNNTVCSNRPEGWEDRDQKQPPPLSKKLDRSAQNAKIWKNVCLFIVVVYVSLLIFANFNLLPFSHLIMKPFLFLMSLLEKIMGKLFWS